VTYAQPVTDSTSVVGRRIGAWFIDLIIYLILSFVITLAFGGATSETHDFTSKTAAQSYCTTWRDDHKGFCFASQDGEKDTAFTIETGGLGSYWLPIHFVLFSVLQGLLGASIGKLLVGLRVVTPDGKQIGIGRSFARTALWIVDAITCALPILGGILMLSTKGHRRVGDMAAGTYVIDKSGVGRPVVVPGVTSGYGTPGYGQQPYGGAGYGQQPAAGAWGAAPQPGTSTWAPSGDAAAPAGTATAEGPTWDAARNAYIQYDRDQGAWVQWSDAAQAWRPIDQ